MGLFSFGAMTRKRPSAYVRDQALLNAFWRAATVKVRHPWASCQLPYRHIAQRLLDQGAPIENENRP